MIESATFWKDGPEIETGELVTEEIGTEVFFLPGRLARGEGRLVHADPADAAVARQGGRAARRRPQRAGVLLRARAADPREAGRAPPTRWTGRCSTWPGTTRSTSTARSTAQAVLREINGTGPDGAALSAYTELKADGSTALRLLDLLRRLRRRGQPGPAAQAALGAGLGRRRVGLGVAGQPADPLQPRLGRTRTGSPWSERKKYVWWDAEQGRWAGRDVPDFIAGPARRTTCPRRARRVPTRSAASDPFVMQTDGKAWLFAPLGSGRRPDADPLRAARVAGAQPAATPSRTTRRGASSTTRATRSTRASARSSPTCSPPTGSPSTTPRAP